MADEGLTEQRFRDAMNLLELAMCPPKYYGASKDYPQELLDQDKFTILRGPPKMILCHTEQLAALLELYPNLIPIEDAPIETQLNFR